VSELFPIVSGLLVGSVLPVLRPHVRLRVAVAASIALGTLATILSGEYAVGWEFLLIDIPLVALCCAAAAVTVRAARRRRRPRAG
jgi:xanthosine utilization system XapX-like protein